MSRPPFDADGLERRDEADASAEQLERYARSVTGTPPADFIDRVMSAVEAEPTPRRSVAAWFGGLGARLAERGWARAGMAAVALVLVVGGVLAAGELARVIDHRPVGNSPSPAVVTSSPSPTPTPTPTPTITPTREPSEAPETPEPSAPEPSESDAATPRQTASPTPHESEHEDQGGGGSETPQPTETPHASED